MTTSGRGAAPAPATAAAAPEVPVAPVPAPSSTPVRGGSSAAASAPPTTAPPDPATQAPDDGPTVAAVPPKEVRVPWIEPGWLVLPLVLVPLLAGTALFLLGRLLSPSARHRRQ